MDTNNNYDFDYVSELSDQELVEKFNREVGVNAWGNARAQFLQKIRHEFLKRELDCSLIIDETSMSLANRIEIQAGVIVYENKNKISLETYTAKINIGLQKNYDNTYYDKSEYIQFLQQYQINLLKEKNIHLSAAVQEFDLVYGNLIEKHLLLNFVNYPKFPLEKNVFKKHINLLGEKLMKQFDQNRILIEYPDESIIFENNESIDPKINP